MAWDPVPYMIGGGAVHSEAVFRLVAFNALRGNEGILGGGDLKVSAFATPGAGVNVAVGSCGILARGSGQTAEVYNARMLTQDTATVAATGAGAGRSDLIIARVEDPNIPGSPWPAPASVANGPYVQTRVISGVPGSTVVSNAAATAYIISQGWSAIPLAGATLPASTAAVTSAMITDLRKVANPQRARDLWLINTGAVVNLTSATYANWIGTWQVPVPSWAVRAVVLCRVDGARVDRTSTTVSGTVTGALRVALGSVATQGVSYDLETTASNVVGRYSLGVADTVAIPSSMKGTTQTLTIQGAKFAGSKNLYADTGSAAVVDVEFQEAAA